jgi:diadenosine tetraphosphate (Ap4A) HIT family hydrolase
MSGRASQPPLAEKIDFPRLEVYCSRFWTWQVHENQSYVGRLVFKLNRSLTKSLAHCSAPEWLDLHTQIQLYEAFLEVLFDPDRINYGQLGNIYPQLHVHAVPRYRQPRAWKEYNFTDERWGANWAPTPTSPLTLEELYAFRDWIANRLDEFMLRKNDRPLAAMGGRP